MRFTPAYPNLPLHVFLDPHRILRRVWSARLVLASAILVAAIFVWNRAEPGDTLIATLAFASAVLGTSFSAIYIEIYRRPYGNRFHALQCAIDLLLVTAIVHITGGWSSQFAALYILVIAAAALLLPSRSGYAVAAISSLLYATDVLIFRGEAPHVGIAVQAAVFLVVGVGAESIAARLRNAGSNREELAARLVRMQLEAADILRSIRSGIITVDAHGRLLYANPAAAELLGLHLRGFVGKPVLRTLREVAPELADLLENSSRAGVRTTRAEGTIRRDSEQFAIGVTTTTTGEKENSVNGVTATAIFQDISDTKRLQALHVRAERLQAVAELSASLAHEIRNPLASIRSATEQLSAMRAPVATVGEDDQRVLHDLVVRETDRLDRLLGEFLDFARARATRITSIDLCEMARTTIRVIESHPARSGQLSIQLECGESGIVVEGDEDLLHRALFNLLLNAVQACGNGASHRIVVAVERMFPEIRDVRSTERTIRITVTDDGPGVPLELRDRIFEPFVTGRTGGTGLGLPVVHRAVEAHAGVVFVEHLAPGTRFTMLLPATQAASGTTSNVDEPIGALYGDVDWRSDTEQRDTALLTHSGAASSEPQE